MALQWSLFGAVGTAAYVLTWTLAAVVYLARPDRAQNRRLAFLLVVLGSHTMFLRTLRLFLDDPSWALASFVTASFLMWLVPFAYAAFVATLQTPVARPLRPRGILLTLLVLGLAGAAYGVLVPSLYFIRVEPFPFFDAWSVIPSRFTLGINYVALVAPPLLAFVAALSAVRHAPTATSRRRATAFAWAFGVHDVIFFLEFGAISTFNVWMDSTFVGNWFQWISALVRAVVLPVLLSYAILRTQLFDIELHLKTTIRKSTVVGAFFAVFFVAFAIAEQYLSQYGVVVGGAAAGLLLLALRPLERVADRFADRAMPNVQRTPEYLSFRKLEVYKAALESAAEDGEVTPKERAVLATLRAKLGIADADASAIERDVLAATGRSA